MNFDQRFELGDGQIFFSVAPPDANRLQASCNIPFNWFVRDLVYTDKTLEQLQSLANGAYLEEDLCWIKRLLV